jgi:tetratricopeptide (TPR) repeat protein
MSPPELVEELNRGIAFGAADRFDDALTCLTRVLEQDPDNVPANLYKGYASLATEDWRSAGTHFQHAAGLEPSAAAEDGWGDALIGLERREQAIWHFDQAASLDDDGSAPLIKAAEVRLATARKAGQDRERKAWALQEAERRLETAIGLPDASAAAALRLGEVRKERNAYRKALEAFQRALQLDPTLPAARLGVADIANDLERYKQARRAVEPLLPSARPENRDESLTALNAWIELIVALTGLREWEEGRRAAAGVLELLADAPEIDDLRDLLWGVIKVQDSALLAQLGQLDASIGPAEEAVSNGGPAAAHGLLLLAAVHTSRGDYRAFAETLIRADLLYRGGPLTDDTQERVSVAQLRVAILDAKQRTEEAFECLRMECQELPDQLDLHMELVKLIARERHASIGAEAAKWQHRLRRAVADARRLLEGRAQLPSATLAHCALEILGDEVDSAHDKLIETAKKHSGSYQAHALLATAAARVGKYDEAVDSFAMAVRLAPHVYTCKLELASAYVHLGNPSAAEACYREVLARAPCNVEALVGLGALLGNREEADPAIYEEAADLLLQALRAADTMNADLSRHRASIRLSKGRRAAVYHQIGFVRTREFEAEASTGSPRRRYKLLREAGDAFAKALREDPDMFLAKRAKARVERERRTFLTERPKWPLILGICALLAALSLAFFAGVPKLDEQLSGPTYSAMTLGLFVLLMATLYMDRLRSLSVAGVSMKKDVEETILTRKLGIEADPSIIELLRTDIEMPTLPALSDAEGAPGEGEVGGGVSQGQAQQGVAPETANQAARTAQSGAAVD